MRGEVQWRVKQTELNDVDDLKRYLIGDRDSLEQNHHNRIELTGESDANATVCTKGGHGE